MLKFLMLITVPISECFKMEKSMSAKVLHHGHDSRFVASPESKCLPLTILPIIQRKMTQKHF